MIILVVSDQKIFRDKQISSLLVSIPEGEVIVYDDTYGSIGELEQYLFPSLFNDKTPVIHLKYMLNGNEGDLTPILVKKMLASPTSFVFEEMELPKGILTNLKKSGAIVHSSEPKKIIKEKNDIFAVTKAITARDKKSKWLAYQESLKSNSVEALIGILYWKIKDLISKSKGDEKEHYKKMYKEMLDAHVRAWQSGAPLSVLIEKVILNH